MLNLITQDNLSFTKQNCNCGLSTKKRQNNKSKKNTKISKISKMNKYKRKSKTRK